MEAFSTTILLVDGDLTSNLKLFIDFQKFSTEGGDGTVAFSPYASGSILQLLKQLKQFTKCSLMANKKSRLYFKTLV